MQKRRGRRLLLAVAVAVVFSALAPATGSAFTGYYNCVLKPVGQWCDGQANGTYDGLHSYDYNEGWYPGSWNNTVTSCEHVWRPATGAELGIGETCAYNWISHYYGTVSCVCYEAEVRQYSGGPHSINGMGEAY